MSRFRHVIVLHSTRQRLHGLHEVAVWSGRGVALFLACVANMSTTTPRTLRSDAIAAAAGVRGGVEQHQLLRAARNVSFTAAWQLVRKRRRMADRPAQRHGSSRLSSRDARRVRMARCAVSLAMWIERSQGTAFS